MTSSRILGPLWTQLRWEGEQACFLGMLSQKGSPNSSWQGYTMQMHLGARQRLLLKNIKRHHRTEGIQCAHVHLWVLKATLLPSGERRTTVQVWNTTPPNTHATKPSWITLGPTFPQGPRKGVSSTLTRPVPSPGVRACKRSSRSATSRWYLY